jgi:hypothetical protein
MRDLLNVNAGSAVGLGPDIAVGLGPDIKVRVGRQLRMMYGDVMEQGVPDRCIEILKQLDDVPDETRK